MSKLTKGEVRYLGYRPDLEANLYAVRPVNGTPPYPLARVLAEAEAMTAAFRDMADSFEACWRSLRLDPADNETLQHARALLARIDGEDQRP